MRKYIYCMQNDQVGLAMIEEGDIYFLRGLICNSETTQFLLRAFPINEADERSWVQSLYKGNPPTNLTYLIVYKSPNNGRAAVGTMGLHHIDYLNGTATTGTVLAPKFRNLGLGTSAKMLLLEYAFNRLNLRVVQSKIMSFNARSIRVQEKCGYREVARIPNWFNRAGDLHDEVILHCTRQSFEEAKVTRAK